MPDGFPPTMITSRSLGRTCQHRADHTRLMSRLICGRASGQTVLRTRMRICDRLCREDTAKRLSAPDRGGRRNRPRSDAIKVSRAAERLTLGRERGSIWSGTVTSTGPLSDLQFYFPGAGFALPVRNRNAYEMGACRNLRFFDIDPGL